MDAVPADSGGRNPGVRAEPTLTDAAPFDASAAGKKDGMDGNPKEQPAAWMAAWMAAITCTSLSPWSQGGRALEAKGQMCTWYCSRECRPTLFGDTLSKKCRPAFPADISCKKVAAEN